MVLTVQEFVLVAVLSVGFFITGRVIKDATTGFIGGLMCMILGLSIFIDPVTGFSNLLTYIFGCSFIGFGGYILIRGSLEEINI